MEQDQRSHVPKETQYHLAGWVLFVICALLFIASSLEHHDPLTLIGSIIFLVACILFILPLVNTLKRNRRDEN